MRSGGSARGNARRRSRLSHSSAPPAAGRRPGCSREVDPAAVQHLLDAAIEAGGEGLFVAARSACAGDVERGRRRPRTRRSRPAICMSNTRSKAERMALRASSQRAAWPSIFRPGSIYGLGVVRAPKLFSGVERGPADDRRGAGALSIGLHRRHGRRRGAVRRGRGGDQRTLVAAEPECATLNELVATVAEELGARPAWLRLPLGPVYAVAAARKAVCRHSVWSRRSRRRSASPPRAAPSTSPRPAASSAIAAGGGTGGCRPPRRLVCRAGPA